MSPDQDFEEKQQGRKVRRRVFHLIFAILVLISGGFLLWKLSGLVAPIIVVNRGLALGRHHQLGVERSGLAQSETSNPKLTSYTLS